MLFVAIGNVRAGARVDGRSGPRVIDRGRKREEYSPAGVA